MEPFEDFTSKKLITTVSTPVYDRGNNSTDTPRMFGVIGFNILLDDIAKF